MKSPSRWILIGCCLASLGLTGCTLPGRARCGELILTYDWHGLVDEGRLNEPSGVVFHPLRGTLFAVGDEGHICELKTDGTMLKLARISEEDYEGITVNPASGLLYVAVEGEDQIVEIHPDTFDVLRQWDVERSLG